MAITGLTASDYGERVRPPAGTFFGDNPRTTRSCINVDADVAEVKTVTIDTVTSSVAKVVEVTVISAVDLQLYRLQITPPGGGIPVNADFTADASATITEIRDGLLAAVDFLGLTLTTATLDANSFTITQDAEADEPAFEAQVDAGVTGEDDLTATTTTAPVISKYVVTADGVAVEFIADATATEAEINAALLLIMQGTAGFAAIYSSAQGVDTSTIVLTAVVVGTVHTVVVSSDLSVANTTAAVDTAPIPFGRATVNSPSLFDGCRLPDIASVFLDFTGVAPLSHAVSDPLAPGGSVVEAYPVGEVISLTENGEIYMQCETDFDPAVDSLFIQRVDDAPSGKARGQVRKDFDGGNAVAATGWRGLEKITAAGTIGIRVVVL